MSVSPSISERPTPATVLVVDDDPVFRSLTRDTLADTGFSVIEADNGLAACERCRDAAPALLVVDAMMPTMDGFTLCRELRGRRPTRDTPILMVTGLQDHDALDRAYEAGATDFIMKPVEWQSFPQRVRYMLRNARGVADFGLRPPPPSARRIGPRVAPDEMLPVSVLIADDDPVVRSVMRDTLEDDGYAVFEAADGVDAVEACRRAPPGMVIADVMMPRMNGFELCRMLRAQPETAHVPILVATGLNDHQSIATAYDVGATDFIVKPFNWLILRYRIRYMLRAAQSFTELVAAKDAAENANHEKSAFLANMSHELRTPLNAVIGFSEIMHRQVLGPISDQYAEYAKIIGDSGSHLLTIITDLLDLAKVEAQGVKPSDETSPVAEIVSFSANMIEAMARDAEIACRVEIEDRLPLFRGDGKRVQQILINLLTNAVKFTPAGGSVSLIARRDLAGGLVFEVADTGIGIPADKIETALAPFGQLHSPQARQDDGIGLGLPLTKRLVELHDGMLGIASTPGAGTTVTVRFPPSRLVPSAALAARD